MKKNVITITIICILLIGNIAFAKINKVDDWMSCSLSEAKKAIKNGYNVNKKDNSGATPLMPAAGFNDVEIVKFLLSEGAKVNIKNKSAGSTALMMSTNNNYEIVKLLLENGANPNIKDNEGLNTLHWAAKFAENPKIIKILIKYDANPNSKSDNGKLPLDLLKQNENLKINSVMDFLKTKTNIQQTKKSKSNKSKYTFRKTKWGMSKKQIKEIEGDDVYFENDGLLVYDNIKVAGYPAQLGYIFTQNKLVRSKYNFIQKHSNENDFITDYKDLKSKLTKKYGKPTSDDHYWPQTLYKDNPEKWGFAISLGHHAYFTEWQNKDTQILLYLTGENYKIDLGIEYTSKEYEELEEEEKEKEHLNDL